MTTLSEIRLSEIRLGPTSSTTGKIRTRDLTYRGAPLEFLLGPSGSLPAGIPFEPRPFDPTSDDPKVGLLLNVDADTAAGARALEDRVRELAGGDVAWQSCLKESATYPAALRCKVVRSGPRAVRLYDADNQPTPWPEEWPRFRCNALCSVSGIYLQGKTAGLLIRAQALQLKPEERVEASPFAVVSSTEENYRGG